MQETTECPIKFSEVKVCTPKGAESSVICAEIPMGGSSLTVVLFIYQPLADAVAAAWNGESYTIPVAPDWPKYSQSVVMQFMPMPTKGVHNNIGQGHLGFNLRQGGTDRSWTQMTYNGWPLYYFNPPNNMNPQSNFATMFIPATPDLTVIITDVPPTNGVGAPGPYLGP